MSRQEMIVQSAGIVDRSSWHTDVDLCDLELSQKIGKLFLCEGIHGFGSWGDWPLLFSTRRGDAEAWGTTCTFCWVTQSCCICVDRGMISLLISVSDLRRMRPGVVYGVLRMDSSLGQGFLQVPHNQ